MLKRPWKETYRKNTDIHEQKIIKKKQDIGRTETLTYKQKTEIKESCDLSKFLQIICVSNINPGQGKLCQHTHTRKLLETGLAASQRGDFLVLAST